VSILRGQKFRLRKSSQHQLYWRWCMVSLFLHRWLGIFCQKRKDMWMSPDT